MPKTTTSPKELLAELLKDLYSAENQLVKALPRLAKAAQNKELKDAFNTHLKQTEGHVKRLEKIGKQLDESMRGKKCSGMEGLIEESKEVLEEDLEPNLRDLALIAAAQKAEHYEISAYGSIRTLAQIAGEDDIVPILQETLDEEGETDKLLTEIAENIAQEVSAVPEEEDV